MDTPPGDGVQEPRTRKAAYDYNPPEGKEHKLERLRRRRQLRLFKGTGPCEGWSGPCDSMDAVVHRMSTAYVNDEENFRILCPRCQKECDEHWEEMWHEYYSGRL